MKEWNELIRIMSGELKVQISLSLQNNKDKTKNAEDSHLVLVFKLCLRAYYHPHFSKIITKINKQNRQQHNNNIKTKKVYS